ncbi:MAG: ABC transporter substrate-binding protein [Gemmatimonadaceae bacterium]
MKEVDGGARRIVSLLPAATDMMAALGVWERVVAVTHECDAVAASLMPPRVTRSSVDASASPADVDQAVRETSASGAPLFTLDAAQIRALEPDLIITQSVCDVCAVSEVDVREIASSMSTPPRILSLNATRFDDVLESVSDVAEVIGVSDEGDELLSGIRVRLRSVHETLKRERAPRPRVAVIEWTDPLYVAGHWVPDMVRRAGGVDIMAEGGTHSRQCTVDELRAANPDVVIVAACGYDLARSANEGTRLLEVPTWKWLGARRVWALDGNALTSRPGPRLCIGVEALARIFHPSFFSAVDASFARALTTP